MAAELLSIKEKKKPLIIGEKGPWWKCPEDGKYFYFSYSMQTFTSEQIEKANSLDINLCKCETYEDIEKIYFENIEPISKNPETIWLLNRQTDKSEETGEINIVWRGRTIGQVAHDTLIALEDAAILEKETADQNGSCKLARVVVGL